MRNAVESLEVRLALAVTPVLINFQPSAAATPSGYVADVGKSYGDRGNGRSFGWSWDNQSNPRDRNSPKSPNQAYDTVTFFRNEGSTSSRKWEIGLPNGTYTVRVVAGDPSYDMGPHITAEGVTLVKGTTTSSNRFLSATKSITVNDGRLTLASGSGSSRNSINLVEITPSGGSTSSGGGSGSISGVLWNDTDGDGTRDSGESPTGSRQVFLDNNRNGQLDSGEKSVFSDSQGRYSFTGLASGTYYVSRVFPSGYRLSNSSAGYITVNLSTGEAETGINLGTTNKTTGSTPPPTSGSSITWPSSWQSGASSPIARFEAHGISHGGKLYVFGGWANSSFESTTRVDVYDPAANTWKRLADMKAPETHAGAALDASTGTIYFIGGDRGDFPSSRSNEIWKYTISSNTWTKLNVQLPYATSGGAAVVRNGKLHYFGGVYSDRVTNTSDHFVLDLNNIGAGVKKLANLPTARDHLSAVVLNGNIYAFGGEIGHDVEHDQQRLMHRYDASSNTWVRLADVPISKSHAESSALVHNGKIIWAGGQIEPQNATANVVQYDPSTGKWTTLKSLPAARQGVIVQKVGNYMVITTGGIRTDQPQRTTWRAWVG